jgi:hypothetical protein
MPLFLATKEEKINMFSPRIQRNVFLLVTLSLFVCILLINNGAYSLANSLSSTMNQNQVAEGPQDKSDDIPWCDPFLFIDPIDPSKIKPPQPSDFPPKPVCKLRTTGSRLPEDEIRGRVNDLLNRYPALKDIRQVDSEQVKGNSAIGLQGNSSLFSLTNFLGIAQPDKTNSHFGQARAGSKSMSNVSLMQAGPVYKYAVHRLTCLPPIGPNDCSSSAPGIDLVTYNVSSYIPILTNGGSWSSLHFYNRVHVTHPSYSSCVLVANASMGYAYGQIGGAIRPGRLVFELFGGGQCNLYDTGINPGNYTMWIQRDTGTSTWRGYIWLGYWYQAFSWSAPFATAAELEAGGELWADSGANLNQVILPVNMINKLSVTGTNNTGNAKPWHNYSLNAPLNNRSGGTYDAPFSVMDNNGWDRTSLAFYYYH